MKSYALYTGLATLALLALVVIDHSRQSYQRHQAQLQQQKQEAQHAIDAIVNAQKTRQNTGDLSDDAVAQRLCELGFYRQPVTWDERGMPHVSDNHCQPEGHTPDPAADTRP